ncbi:MAG TPA: helix-turn-helix transcriptional regulator [Cellvibrionaceae bacterium]
MNNTIKDRRKANGWSQSNLADKLEVSRQTIIAIEKGKYDPSLPLAFRIARVFGVTIEEVFLEESG